MLRSESLFSQNTSSLMRFMNLRQQAFSPGTFRRTSLLCPAFTPLCRPIRSLYESTTNLYSFSSASCSSLNFSRLPCSSPLSLQCTPSRLRVISARFFFRPGNSSTSLPGPPTCSVRLEAQSRQKSVRSGVSPVCCTSSLMQGASRPGMLGASEQSCPPTLQDCRSAVLHLGHLFSETLRTATHLLERWTLKLGSCWALRHSRWMEAGWHLQTSSRGLFRFLVAFLQTRQSSTRLSSLSQTIISSSDISSSFRNLAWSCSTFSVPLSLASPATVTHHLPTLTRWPSCRSTPLLLLPMSSSSSLRLLSSSSRGTRVYTPALSSTRKTSLFCGQFLAFAVLQKKMVPCERQKVESSRTGMWAMGMSLPLRTSVLSAMLLQLTRGSTSRQPSFSSSSAQPILYHHLLGRISTPFPDKSNSRSSLLRNDSQEPSRPGSVMKQQHSQFELASSFTFISLLVRAVPSVLAEVAPQLGQHLLLEQGGVPLPDPHLEHPEAAAHFVAPKLVVLHSNFKSPALVLRHEGQCPAPGQVLLEVPVLDEQSREIVGVVLVDAHRLAEHAEADVVDLPLAQLETAQQRQVADILPSYSRPAVDLGQTLLDPGLALFEVVHDSLKEGLLVLGSETALQPEVGLFGEHDEGLPDLGQLDRVDVVELLVLVVDEVVGEVPGVGRCQVERELSELLAHRPEPDEVLLVALKLLENKLSRLHLQQHRLVGQLARPVAQKGRTQVLLHLEFALQEVPPLQSQSLLLDVCQRVPLELLLVHPQTPQQLQPLPRLAEQLRLVELGPDTLLGAFEAGESALKLPYLLLLDLGERLVQLARGLDHLCGRSRQLDLLELYTVAALDPAQRLGAAQSQSQLLRLERLDSAPELRVLALCAQVLEAEALDLERKVLVWAGRLSEPADLFPQLSEQHHILLLLSELLRAVQHRLFLPQPLYLPSHLLGLRGQVKRLLGLDQPLLMPYFYRHLPQALFSLPSLTNSGLQLGIKGLFLLKLLHQHRNRVSYACVAEHWLVAGLLTGHKGAEAVAVDPAAPGQSSSGAMALGGRHQPILK